jgi:hypothetical protein
LSYLKKNPNYASSLSARRSYTTITTLGMWIYFGHFC